MDSGDAGHERSSGQKSHQTCNIPVECLSRFRHKANDDLELRIDGDVICPTLVLSVHSETSTTVRLRSVVARTASSSDVCVVCVGSVTTPEHFTDENVICLPISLEELQIAHRNAMDLLPFKISVGSGYLLIWVIILHSHFPFSTGCLQHERSYLLDFKAGLNLSSGRLSSWRGLNCCEWEGVACDYHTSHVVRLDLSNDPWGSDWYKQQLSGELRPSLFNLQHLQHLDLSGNSFSGLSIPPQLSQLERLTFLRLSDAGFLGQVPLELGNMSSLRHLDISNNYDYHKISDSMWQVQELKSGNIPDLSNLTHLSHLHIGENSFPVQLPSWFENVSSLVSLDLRDCDLQGSIPSNFMARSRLSILVLDYNYDLTGNLSFMLSHSSSLVMLYLSECNLTGVFPTSIANFSKLMTMDLASNNFEGSIPSSFCSLTSLRHLHLNHNQLSGQIPPSLCELPELSNLVLGHNQFSGTIPDCLSKLSSLEMLSLHSSGLRGNISLQLFENLTRLSQLDLSENQFFIDISTSWVPQFAHLEILELRSCSIEGNFPAFLSQQYQLSLLDLSDNNIVGNLPSWLWDLPYLDMLNLSNNNLEGSLPFKISLTFHTIDLHGNRLYGSLPALDFVSYGLDLSNNGFNGSIPTTIGIIYTLSLSGNNLTGEIPSSICNNSDYYYYRVLDLSKNKLTGMIPSNIGRCSEMKILKLAQNVLQGEIPKELGNLQSLRTLNLNGNRLQGIIPPSIANCTDLQIFDLGNNNFEGSIPVWIEKLTDLRILSLASNKFDGRIPPQLFRLQYLQILDLPDNQLSGNIPSDVSKLSALVNNSQSFYLQYSSYEYSGSSLDTDYGINFADEVTVWIKGRITPYSKIIGQDKFMDLSHNNLSGNIPLELGLLRGLISLNISKNNLSGVIPESLGALTDLESLDLSENNFSREIPIQLLNLTFLAVLNLSNNMLSGLIPQGKQFSTFGVSSFLGNPNLHGPPLENKTQSLGFGRQYDYKELNNTTTESADTNVMDRWWAVGVGLSYGLGFATVITVLCFHMKWRYICFFYMDNFIYDLFE
ncbi:receptor like protein 23-like [Cryptomeria japonica]|uniref:receptor like protein 23-like n=1 Tax=Cryptomeria japonica TaxID=3369 RepID=UPI0027DA036D|nr:receptor like protein 23-like [Cryptomeria japonica]